VSQALRERIEKLAASRASGTDAEGAIDELLTELESGRVRAAERSAAGVWRAVPWVKTGILLAFRAGRVVDMSPPGSSPFHFSDKHTLSTQAFALDRRVRIVPGGSTVRRGTFVGTGVVCMPPMFINTGAYVGAGTMVDSHALVGSCAQIGERVHVSAAAQIGGVLEPVNATPVVVEDDAFIGGNCGVYEGTIVRKRAVLAPGVLLTRGTPVFDLVHEKIYRASGEASLEIPEGAVVVPGARRAGEGWSQEFGLSLAAPVIVKYRDASTDAATALESSLR
jgi:2,3,4,5-tetrahydropyridine-2-carboxylate N-succinyltransferase